jgi:hypothetical protein
MIIVMRPYLRNNFSERVSEPTQTDCAQILSYVSARVKNMCTL